MATQLKKKKVFWSSLKGREWKVEIEVPGVASIFIKIAWLGECEVCLEQAVNGAGQC